MKWILSSTRSNKETQLLLSSDPICKLETLDPQRKTLLIDRHSPTTVNPDTDSVDRHSPTTVDRSYSSVNRYLPSDIDRYFIPKMVATLVLVRDENGDLHDHEGHLRNAAVDTTYKDDLHTEDYDEDYEEERATEYRGIHAKSDRLLHHSYGIRNATSINRRIITSINTHHHHTNHKRALIDIAYYTSIDTGVNHAKEGDHSIGSWTDDYYHESYAVKTAIHEPGADELNEGFTTEELLNHQDPEGYARAMDGHALQVSRKDIAYILQMANGAENLFVQQCNTPEHQRRVTNESYNTAGGVDGRFKPKYREHTQPSIDRRVSPSIDSRQEFGKVPCDRDGIRRFYCEQRDEYGVYRDAHGHARATYVCLPEHERSFTHTKLVPEIYTKDKINEMIYGICGAQGNNEDEFQMKLDGVYCQLNDNISWLTTCLEEMRQNIAKM
ncbi:hypothetical protein F2Q70_00035798 [Brassica cretica]|uniref:Uncharacterized protein n=1 Tax=Brassica cretica TaxID=69181 RepID=A0A8S9K0G8_BRACR|nr:hypothetical protein F2Q70_00035798 [Brassica cretica]